MRRRQNRELDLAVFCMLSFLILVPLASASMIALAPARVTLSGAKGAYVRIFNQNEQASNISFSYDGNCAVAELKENVIRADGYADIRIIPRAKGQCMIIFMLDSENMLSPSAALKVDVISVEEPYEKRAAQIFSDNSDKIGLKKPFKGIMIILTIIIAGLVITWLVKPSLFDEMMDFF